MAILSDLTILTLAALAGVIVYLVFMFKNGWYAQTILGLAIAGGLVSGILGVHRLTDAAGDQWLGAVLLLGGLVVMVISAIAIRKMFPRSGGSGT